MDNVMDEVDQRTNLAFSNQMEMLTFFLTDGQQYGINVFKIIEVIETPKDVTQVPKSHPAITGAINFRDNLVTAIDLSQALGMKPVDYANDISYVIICEYSNNIQGFLISSPNKLMNKSWEDIKRPAGSIQNSGYLTAITYDGGPENSIQILDVEKILGEILGIEDEVADELIQESRKVVTGNNRVLVLDDSRSAINLLEATLRQLGITRIDKFNSAEKALEALERAMTAEREDRYNLIISDIEMPGMDGFTFTRKVKAHPVMSKVHLVLHSSMSNKSNRDKATQVGADGFIPKFQPDGIARLVLDQFRDGAQA
ncbi:MAG: chemotaxis protein CheV [Magnetococcales bacterium]|nr:chemotaxis protein CheV [Magnetococcales bacterium]